MHNPNMKIYISCLVNSCRYRNTISIDVLWMSVPDKNLTKHTLLVQRSPQALIHYHTMVSPHFTHQTKHAREREREREKKREREKRQEGERQTDRQREIISSLHEIISSLMSLFLWYMKVVVACKVSSVFNHISPSFLKFNKLSTPCGEHQKAPW